MSFAVDLPQFAGPLDLLLFLVRREELDIGTLSMARVLEQYFDAMALLQEITIDDVGDFVEVASILIEMKARHVLPADPLETQQDIALIADDPSDDLVTRLVQYKRYRDVAAILDERSRSWQLRYTRLPNDLPARKHDPSEQPIADLEIWDLVSAFGRILRAQQPAPADNVIYDDTPIHVYMKQIHELVQTNGSIELQDLFRPGQHKSTLVAIFLATLELSRHHGVLAHQQDGQGALWLSAGADFAEHLEIAEVDNLSEDALVRSNFGFRPR